MRMVDRWRADNEAQELFSLTARVRAVIIGGAVGDALGVPYEFRPRDTFVATDMVGYGTYNQPEGSWSDDTSLTLCLVENFIEEGELPSLYGKFLDYKKTGKWTPYGKCFDMGSTTLLALRRYEAGIPIGLCGGDSEMDNGNGALMRISPVMFAVLYNKDFQYLINMVRKYSGVTHRHPRSVLGCVIYVFFLKRLFLHEDFDRALSMTVEFCHTNIEDEDLRKEFPRYHRILNEEIMELTREDIISDGYVVHSLEAALWCFATTNSYQKAVLKAVNLGGDTDTIASLVGTLAGLKYGVKDIPKVWINQLARIEDITELCEKFSEYCYKIKKSSNELFFY